MTATIVQTERFVGRPICEGDLSDLCRLHADRRVMATLSADGEPLPRDHVEKRLRRALQHWDEHGYGIWVFRTPRGDFVGRAGIQHRRIDDADEVEILYALIPEYWGSGAATEIARCLVDTAVGAAGLSELICFALADNHAWKRVMEKVGFRLERDFTHLELPHTLYRLDAAAWRAAPHLSHGTVEAVRTQRE